MERNDRPDARIARIAARQRGLATAEQLRGCGLGDAAIARRVGAGRLHRLFRGVYLVGHPVPPPLAWETAALLAGGPSAVLSHHSAAALWRFGTRDEVVHLTVPGRKRRPQRHLRPHAHRLAPSDVRSHHGLRLTSPQRTLTDLASFLEPAVHERWTNEAEVLQLVPRRPGALPTRREAERRLKELLLRAGLPPTHTNVTVAGWEVDVLYAPERLVVEFDSFQFHGTKAALERDRRKDAELLAAGYRVLRVTWRQVSERPERLVAQLARALAAA